jgi:spore coat polysaccharide biosynthesis predicted glycosyltransferase SpsG
MPLGTLLIRADATHATGHGHVMRCLALAQAWQDRCGDCMFAMADPLPVLEARLCSENIPVTRIASLPGSTNDAKQLSELASKNNTRWIVLDGYQFGVDYQRTLKDADHRILAIACWTKTRARLKISMLTGHPALGCCSALDMQCCAANSKLGETGSARSIRLRKKFL